MTQLEFTGHVLSKNGIWAVYSMIKAVVHMRCPTNATKVRSFYRLVNYFGGFIPNVDTIPAPLRMLRRQSYKWT